MYSKGVVQTADSETFTDEGGLDLGGKAELFRALFE